jgi:hypothetical protein
MKDLNEIDVLVLLKKIYLRKKFIIKCSLISVVFGIVISLNTTNLYTSTTIFIPQLSTSTASSSSTGLSGLASLAGINIGSMNNSNNFPAKLYPQILESFPFKSDLLSSKINFDDNKMSIRQYYISTTSTFNFSSFIYKYTFGLPGKIINLFNKNATVNNSSNSEIYSISEIDYSLFKEISNNCTIDINDKEGFISISCTDRNKIVAAQITRIVQNLLQEKIIEYKVQSSNELLDFTTRQYNEIKSAFEELQDNRAIFVDKNLNISSSLYQNKLSRIESELNIAQTEVQQLASQVEQAKIQVSKNTPVFTTIQPVTVPFERASPKRSLIVLTYFFIGLLLATFYILLKDQIKELFKSIKS